MSPPLRRLDTCGERVRALVRTVKAETQFFSWLSGPWPAVAPRRVKWKVLDRWSIPDAPWVETGTYRGDTTLHLARRAPRVVSIEADETLYRRAVCRFKPSRRIMVLHGRSEDVLAEVLRSECGPVNLWLDAHYSGQGTFEGESQCPIEGELEAISQFLDRGERVSVFIDDARLFGGAPHATPGYPSLQFLVEWATGNALSWTIEYDIFVATSV